MPLGFAWFVNGLPFGQRFVLVEFDDATPPNRHISAALAETEVRGRPRDHGVTGGDIDVGLASAKIRARRRSRRPLGRTRGYPPMRCLPAANGLWAADHDRPATRRSGS